jgi:hypothetical protein
VLLPQGGEEASALYQIGPGRYETKLEFADPYPGSYPVVLTDDDDHVIARSWTNRDYPLEYDPTAASFLPENQFVKISDDVSVKQADRMLTRALGSGVRTFDPLFYFLAAALVLLISDLFLRRIYSAPGKFGI